MWFKDKKLNIFIIFLNIIFILNLLKCSYEIIDFNFYFIFAIFIVCILIYGAYSIVLHNNKQRLIFTLVVVGAFGLFVLLKKDFIETFFIKGIVQNITDINENLYSGKSTYFYQYINILILVVPVVSFLCFFLDSKGLLSLMCLIDICIMGFLWYLNYKKEVLGSIFKISIVGIIIYGLDRYKSFMKRLNNNNIRLNIERKSIITTIIIYSVVLSIIIKIIPTDFPGKYESKINDKVVNYIATDENGKGTGDNKFSLSKSGYNDGEKKLGGKITLDNEKVFKVSGEEPIHLKGSVKDTYTGYSWVTNTNVRREFIKENSIRAYLVKKHININSNTKKIYIYPKTLRTDNFFVPNYTTNLIYDKGKVYTSFDESVFNTNKIIEDAYEVEYLDEKVLNKVIEKLRVYNETLTEEYKNCLQIPHSITHRTKELAMKITENCNTNLEKVDKIREYLEQNYTYSLDVQDVPEGVDFVDHFLFEEKKGYCVYFATATTIMCRIVGVPARYVEGFKMPNERSKDGFYYVTNRDAHAWTEVGVPKDEGLWITVDSSVTATEHFERTNSQSKSNTDTNGDEEFFKKDKRDKNDEEQKVEENQVSKVEKIDINKVIFSIIIAIMIIYIIFRVTLEIIRRNKVIKSRSYIPLYIYAQRRLKSIGIVREDTETELDFARRLTQNQIRNGAINLVERVYDEYYGGDIKEDFDKKAFYELIEKYIRDYNVVLYYIKKYIIFYRIR